MLSWHGLRLEAVCGMGCEEERGTVREKQGRVLASARDRGKRTRGQMGRTHVEPHHDLCSRGFFMVVYLWQVQREEGRVLHGGRGGSLERSMYYS